MFHACCRLHGMAQGAIPWQGFKCNKNFTTIRRIEMAGKFEIYKDKAGEFRFRLKSSKRSNR
eukprot:UN05120